MMGSSELLSPLYSKVLDLPPSCIEFCPAFPAFFVVGTYDLQKNDSAPDSLTKEQENTRGQDVGSKRPQNRNGSLLVFRLQDEVPSLMQTLPQPSAVLDLHFQPHDGKKHICGVASSAASLAILELNPPQRPGSPLQCLTTLTLPGVDDDVLFLSFAWHPSEADTLAITTSSAQVHLVRLGGQSRSIASTLSPIITHSLEAWTVAFSPRPLFPTSPPLPEPVPVTLYSGGDDSILQYVSCTLTSSDDDPGFQIPYAAASVKGHGAGVTAILPLTLGTPDGSRLVVTGSYDDTVRVYSIMPLHLTYGAPVAKLLGEKNLEGGVWRLKVIQKKERSQPDDSNDPKRSRIYILASCMHAGTRILEVCVSQDGTCRIEVLARFEEHKSMNYGSDYRPYQKGEELICVSTSFYDKLLCTWSYSLP